MGLLHYYQLDALIALGAFAACIGIGLFALYRWKSAALRFWFMTICALAAVWCLNDYHGAVTASRTFFVTTLQAGSIGWIFMGPGLFIFLSYFLGREGPVRTRSRRLLLFAAMLPVWGAFETNPERYFQVLFSPEAGHYFSAPTRWFIPILASILVWVAIALGIIFTSWRDQADPLLRRRARLLGLILFGTVALAVATDVLLPALGFAVPTLGGAALGWFCISIFALAKRFQLLSSAQVLNAKVDQLQEFSRALEEKVAERTRELRESEQGYREIFENVQEFILSLDLEGRITSANPQVKQTMGFKTDPLVGKKLAELIEGYISPQMLEHWEKVWREIQATVQKPGDLFREEVTMPIASGELRAFLFIYSGIFREGRLVGYLHIGRDVTESQRAEEALQKSEKRLSSLVENMNDWVWEVDRNGIYIYVSPIVKDLLGYEPEEVIGKTPCDFMPQDEAERVAGVLKDLIASPKPFAGLENTNLHKDGRKLVLETSGVPIYDQEGNFSGYQGADRDITERKWAEKALRESEERYREIFDNVQEMIQSMDLEGRILSGNPRVRTLLGGNPEQNQGRLFSEVIADNLPPAILEKWQKAWQQIRQGIQKPGDVFQEEVILPLASGEFKTLAFTYSGIFRQGRLAGYLQMGRDITESVKLKKALEEYSTNLERLVAERTRELVAAQGKMTESARLAGMAEMAAGVLHNIGNAINSIGVRLEMLKSHVNGRCGMEMVAQTLGLIEQNHDRLGPFWLEDPKGSNILPFLRELVAAHSRSRQELQETLRFIQGQVQHIAEIMTLEQRYHRPGVFTESTDLNRLIGEALEMMRDSLKRRGVEVEQDLAELPLVNLNRNQMMQVIYNLLKNAVEALEQNPAGERRVKVQSRMRPEPEGGVEIVVEDNGAGIRVEDSPQLFRFGFTTKAESGGHGFGLHASANFIQSLGGRLEAESAGPGRGSRFYVRLPRNPEPETLAEKFAKKETQNEPAHFSH